MRLIDDLKQIIVDAGIDESKAVLVIQEFAKRYGGARWYINKKVNSRR